jgi:hypothetical protein
MDSRVCLSGPSKIFSRVSVCAEHTDFSECVLRKSDSGRLESAPGWVGANLIPQ